MLYKLIHPQTTRLDHRISAQVHVRLKRSGWLVRDSAGKFPDESQEHLGNLKPTGAPGKDVFTILRFVWGTSGT